MAGHSRPRMLLPPSRPPTRRQDNLESTMTSSLCTGSPRFADSKLAALHAGQGAAAAWSQAYSDRGIEALQGVAGDFAVALRPREGCAFLAVDRFAVRTLCYRVDGDTLRFAERADALADGGSDGGIDPQAIFDYLYFHVIPSPRTIFRNVFRLPPGHYALFENGVLTVAPYWIPAFEEGRSASFGELKEEFRSLLANAVKDEIEGKRVGCFLSGGTDSSTVAGMLSQVGGAPAETYSIGFEAEGYDEMEFARIAAKHFGARHHEYYVTPEDLVKSIPEVARYYDQPFGNSSALPAYYCASMARADGIQKMLAGDGGDELFGGNTRYAKQRVFHLYWGVPAGLRRGLVDPLASATAGIPLMRKLDSYVQQARVPMPDRTQTYNLLMRLGMQDVLAPGFLARIDAGSPLEQQREVWQMAHSKNLVNQMLAFDWRYTLAETDLPKVVGTTALADVAVGFPMLDDRLVDFSLRLPPEYKLKGLKLRWFFKEALRGFLPDAIIAKKKQGFGLPFGVWTTRNSGLMQLARTSLESIANRGIVRPEFIDALLNRYLPEHPGYYGEMVWILLMLEQWLQGHAPDFKIPGA